MRSALATTRSLQFALDVLLGALVVLTIVGAFGGGGGQEWLIVACAAVFGALYSEGRRRINTPDDVDAPRGALWPAGAWIWALIAVWAALLALVDAALWIAFPLMFLQMHVLGPRRGPIAVAVTVLIAGWGGLTSGLAPVGSVLGPVLGAGVAVGVVLGLEAVVRESAERLRIIEELTRTRADLAAVEGERATIAERERLAREIHDTLAQGFSSIGLLLRAADRDLGQATPESVRSARAHVATAQQAVHENLVEARRVVRALAPPALDAANLVAAIERLAERTSVPGGLQVLVEVTGDQRELPAPVETALLRIAQSAVANVVQHAYASRAQITVTFYTEGITLDVVDDGIGFDPAAVTRSATNGFGILAMRSRVAELGGTLELESSPVHAGGTNSNGAEDNNRPGARIGTALVVQVPLPTQEETS